LKSRFIIGETIRSQSSDLNVDERRKLAKRLQILKTIFKHQFLATIGSYQDDDNDNNDDMNSIVKQFEIEFKQFLLFELTHYE
jgi:hypothetical protein